jgi:cell shape-determining protein MreC
MRRYKPLQPRRGSALRINAPARVALIILALVVVVVIVRAIVNRVGHSIPLIYGDTVRTALSSKRALVARVTALENTLAGYEAERIEYNILRAENDKLKTELGRDSVPAGILAHPITEPNRSFYTTFVIDAGSAHGIAAGQRVYAFNSVAIGTIESVEEQHAVVQLYSAPGRETSATAEGSEVTVTLVGRGGGEYEVRMPRNVPFDIGNIITEQSVYTGVLARVEKVITDPRDPFQRLLAKTPINLQALKWVVVR